MRIKVWISILLAIPLLMLLPARSSAQGIGPGVSGKVVNGSPDGQVPTGTTVTLQFFDEETWKNTYNTEIQQDGSFILDDLSAEIGNSYVVYVDYLNAIYTSQQYVLDENGNSSVEITVYETTDRAQDILINDLFFLIYPHDDRIQITEIYQMVNPGSYTYIGKKSGPQENATFTWTVPDGAQNLKVGEPGLGERFFADEDKYYDTYPIRPQPYIQEVYFSYEIPSSQHLLMIKSLEFPLEAIYIAGNTGQFEIVENEGFKKSQMPDNALGIGEVYMGGPYQAGEDISFSIEISESASQKSKLGSLFVFERQNMILGVSAFIIALIICIAIIKNPDSPVCPEEIKSEINKIYELENKLQLKTINKEEYENSRKEIISRIIVYVDSKREGV